MEIAMIRQRHHASVRVSDNAWMQLDFERLIIHELLHLVFDPISEQHEFAVELFAISEDTSRALNTRHLTEVEKAVEHLSYVLYNA